MKHSRPQRELRSAAREQPIDKKRPTPLALLSIRVSSQASFVHCYRQLGSRINALASSTGGSFQSGEWQAVVRDGGQRSPTVGSGR